MSNSSVHQMVESIIGCKWSLTVLSLVRKGVRRPGEMEHAIDGLSGKVLNERLAKLVRFGILDKTSFPEVPPRVEYDLTAFGTHFITLINQIDELQQTLERTTLQRSGSAKSRSVEG
jgi:DNA-binding HxlR family transcriptional regulator